MPRSASAYLLLRPLGPPPTSSMLRVAMPDSSNIEHVVVVGASIAGVRAAEQLHRRGFSGRLTLVGRERHFPPSAGPPLSKEVLSHTWEVEDARLHIFEDLDATMVLGHTATALRLDTRAV